MTLEEYMRELILMSRQYGQEEELYPLINMLLRENAKVGDLSVRDVHNAKGKIYNELCAYVAFPDLAILGENDTLNNLSVYGCVEVKQFRKSKEFISLDNGFNGGKTITCPYVALINKKKSSTSIYEIENEENIKNVQLKRYKEKEINDIKDIKLKNGNISDNDTTSVILRRSIKLDDKLYDESVYKSFIELIAELLWYKRVLYTNGLKWYYIELKNSIKIKKDGQVEKKEEWLSKINGKYIDILCVNLGELKEIKTIKDQECCIDVIKRHIDDENRKEWNRLKYNLASINWFGSNTKEQFL